jgi:hypothetical protein
MRKISARLPMRVLAGSAIAACLLLSGATPAATAAPANATMAASNAMTARTVTAAAPAGAAALPALTLTPGMLKSVSAVSASNAWAVGTGAVTGGLICH